jgi:HEAT repeat protein
MRIFLRLAIVAVVLSATNVLLSQQPTILHGEITTDNHGLGPALDNAKKGAGIAWIGYSVPVVSKFSNGWRSNDIEYLEGTSSSEVTQSDDNRKTFDHANILLRVADGAVTKIRVSEPDRQLDAGGVHFMWLTTVNPDDSVRILTDLAKQDDPRRVRENAVFAISIHQTNSATTALISLADPKNDLALREKAAFWLANQRGPEGLAAIKQFAHNDTDPKFREKLTFDLTLSKDPSALDEIIRMAHEDASPQVRKQAQFWMANKGGKRVTEDLRAIATNDPNEQIRKSAVFALSRLPGEEAATQLIAVADSSKDPTVRRQAIFWLGQSNDPRALEYLTRLLKQ